MKLQNPVVGNVSTLVQNQVDVYKWRNKLVARSWPRKTTIPPTPQQSANRLAFGQASAAVAAEPIQYQKAIRWMNLPKGRSGLDVMRKFLLIWIKDDQS